MTPPNIITLARLLSVPVAVWLILIGSFAPAFWLFVAAGISDGVDGFIAKRFDLRSELGAILDPLADKALLMSVYVTLGVAGVLPALIVILVVARDVMILGGFLLLGVLGQTPKVHPLRVSKANTVLQIALAGFVLATCGYGVLLPGVGWFLLWAVAASTLLSGGAYLVQWSRAIGRNGRPT